MTTLKDMLKALDTVGIPYTQFEFEPAQHQSLPCAVVVPHATHNRFADGCVLAMPVRYDVEVYTRERDIPLEKRIQKAFDDARIGYERYHSVDEVGHSIVTVYEMTLFE